MQVFLLSSLPLTKVLRVLIDPLEYLGEGSSEAVVQLNFDLRAVG